MSAESLLIGSLILQWHRAFLRAAEAVGEEEFLGKSPVTISLGWTLLHLTGFQEWAVGVLTGEPTSAPVELLEHFRGGDRVVSLNEIPISKDGVIKLFVSANIRVESLFNSNRYFDLKAPIREIGARNAFPNVGELLAALASQGFYHLGQMSLASPTFIASPFLTLPTQYKEGVLLSAST
jgi:hypothetical protein